MPLTVRDLLAIPSLRLRLVAGSSGLGRVVEAAHATENIRPASWLEGAEVVMTSGLLLSADESDCAAYVEELSAGKAAALIVGVGPGLPLQSVPAALGHHAELAGMPVLAAPPGVAFAAVTKAVFAARASEERRLLEKTLRTQRRLSSAAASGDGLTGLLSSWFQAVHSSVAVCDASGRLLGSAGTDGPELLTNAAPVIETVALHGLRGSGGVDLPCGRLVVQPLGTTRLRGFLILLNADSAEARLLISVLVSLLSVELERRHLADEPQRRRRAALLARLFQSDITAEQARSLLQSAGVPSSTIRAVAVLAAGDPVELAADLALAVPGGLARVTGGRVEMVVSEDLDTSAVLRRFAPGRPAGVGPAVAPQHAALSMRQAIALLSSSTELGRPVSASEAGSVRLLLGLGSPATLAAFADTVLAPLDAADPGGELIETLRVWLETNGSWAETSSLLGLHRHTVQNRIEKVARLTGRQQDRAEDRVDLWLALTARAAGTPLPHQQRYRNTIPPQG
ncbi:PucR family transcriptional regulator [Streptomyces sp. NBC_00233]|uniref:PucR family transcriptional regulator n=1 Tax=Streptomyces sp. NBC_00233 TaxID=2975686 RepID=UPI002250C4EC|nr:PucR family transcriptional regulator [Streptomyces sp. NBC_00233]MCX5232888.1 PucR family transcriptional regulator [Streptomyces sp. NBC_00233]